MNQLLELFQNPDNEFVWMKLGIAGKLIEGSINGYKYAVIEFTFKVKF